VVRETWDVGGAERNKALLSVHGASKKLKSLDGHRTNGTRTRQKKVISGRGSYRQKPAIAQTLQVSENELSLP